MSFNIVLYQPEIPQNTGNVARTCAATGSRLHIIRPTGFEVTDKNLKRAGLDYWYLLDITYYDGLDDFFAKNPDITCYYSTTKAPQTHCEPQYRDGDYLMFGKETAGLPEELLYANRDTCIRIPMISDARSLNLANSAAVVLYEALRQTEFLSLKGEGELTQFEW